MKIIMLTSVEDSQAYLVETAEGKSRPAFDVRKFREGEIYENTGPMWESRAARFIKLGYADEVV